MRPSGPLPPRVYWVRRLIVGVVAAISFGLVIWLLMRDQSTASADPGPTGPTAAQPSTTGSPGEGPGPGKHGRHGRNAQSVPGTKTGPASTADPTTGQPTGRPTSEPPTGQPTSGPPHSPQTDPPTATHSPLAAPTGDCDPAQVKLSIDVADSVAGHRNPVTFVLTVPRSAEACALQITPDTFVARVTSGPDVVWSSGDCADALLVQQVVVRNDPATVYRFEWNGHRSTEHCATAGEVAPPGGYWIEAALVGGEPHKAFFDVTESRSSR